MSIERRYTNSTICGIDYRTDTRFHYGSFVKFGTVRARATKLDYEQRKVVGSTLAQENRAQIVPTFWKKLTLQPQADIVVRVPAVYLTSAFLSVLSALSEREVNNLRVSNGLDGPIPTPSEFRSSTLLLIPAYGRAGEAERAGAPLSMYARSIFCCSGVRMAFADSIASR